MAASRPEEPIHISGAGPSGLTAAVVLRRAGRSVVVHERAMDVGHRFHNDFQGLENWTTDGDVLQELAALGIEARFEHTPFRDVTLFDPGGGAHRYRSAQPLFHLVRRGAAPGTLDAGLKAQALGLGAEIRFGDVTQRLPGGGLVAEGPHGADAIAVGYTFTTSAADGAYGALSDRLAPEGYAYLLLCGGRGTIASCMFNDFHDERDCLERTVTFFRQRVDFDMRDARRFGGVGNVAVPATARRGALLLVGEAAGFQDALWGFGMRFAMLSGSLAARSLLSDGREDYDRLWQQRLGGTLRAGLVNRLLYRQLGDPGYHWFARVLERAEDPRAWLGRRYGPSLLTGLLYPLAGRMLRSRRRTGACPRAGCDCTWCRCRAADRPPAG